MTTTDRIDPALRRVRAPRGLLVSGGLLLVVGNAAHPLDRNPTHLSRLELATGPGWLLVHLTLALGFLLVTAGMLAVTRRLEARGEGTVTHVASAAALVGGVFLVAVFGALDGYAVAALADSHASPQTIEAAALAEESIDSGLAGVGTLALFGLAIGATSLAMITSRVGRRWVASSGLVVGAISTVAGITLLVQGPTQVAINLLLRPAAIAGTLWFVIVGLTFRDEAVDTGA